MQSPQARKRSPYVQYSPTMCALQRNGAARLAWTVEPEAAANNDLLDERVYFKHGVQWKGVAPGPRRGGAARRDRPARAFVQVPLRHVLHVLCVGTVMVHQTRCAAVTTPAGRHRVRRSALSYCFPLVTVCPSAPPTALLFIVTQPRNILQAAVRRSHGNLCRTSRDSAPRPHSCLTLAKVRAIAARCAAFSLAA